MLVLHTLCHVLLVSSVLAALIHTTNVHLVPTVQKELPDLYLVQTAIMVQETITTLI